MWPTTTRPPRLIFLRQLAHQVDVHAVGRRADVEMDVDVDVEFAGELEDALDLAGLVRVVARRAADHAWRRASSPSTSSSSVPG